MTVTRPHRTTNTAVMAALAVSLVGCSGSGKVGWAASQRFTYEDVTTTEAQGKQINEALKGLGFCKT
ncbi:MULTISPECIES: hypothetical protein [Streptomyces]|uniref:Uncharacterized protein n=1 Tax=Streptomyces canarius TaxID=285453 RepID=A0ABQ3CGC7_9ACTN|nr:hypothetical protein [Streptomyces canarius]GHA09421.1 hypothetical protein GCM10010345_12420 [Streptomyces canarius]